MTEPDKEQPPIFGSWKNLYTAVLILHAVLITVLYLFSQSYQG